MDIARTPKQIGAVIQRRRRAKALSQSKLGELCGLRQEMVSKIESGHPGTRLRTILDLLAALDLELNIVPRAGRSASDVADIF